MGEEQTEAFSSPTVLRFPPGVLVFPRCRGLSRRLGLNSSTLHQMSFHQSPAIAQTTQSFLRVILRLVARTGADPDVSCL